MVGTRSSEVDSPERVWHHATMTSFAIIIAKRAG